MTDSIVHAIDTAPEPAQAILRGAQKAPGFVPKLYATLAEAPPVLEGYMALSNIFSKTGPSETERRVIRTAARKQQSHCYRASRSENDRQVLALKTKETEL